MLKTNKYIYVCVVAVIVMTLCGCYHDRRASQDGQPTTVLAPTDSAQLQQLSFASTHHYSIGYNFVVKARSLTLVRQQPEEIVTQLPTDSLCVMCGDRLVVVDIRTLPSDPIDSVWVQVARDQSTFGWIHENQLLKGSVPDDPISQFISTFSDTHLLIFLVVIAVIAISYLLHNILKQKAFIVHFNDIPSPYPTLLAVTVATAAAFYSSIQLFAPDVWRHFYYNPSLNPFSLPPLLGIFISAVWAILILALAATDDVRHQLPFGQAVLYLAGLAGICAALYIIFSITTLYYIGYPLLAAYVVFAIYRYMRFSAYHYICGSCGRKLHAKGRCPYCGSVNE